MADPVGAATDAGKAAAGAPGKAAKGIAGALQGKVFGMDKRIFLALLVGGLAIGLYLRNRAAQQQAAMDNTDGGGDGSATTPDPNAPADGGFYDPGLAGLGPVTGDWSNQFGQLDADLEEIRRLLENPPPTGGGPPPKPPHAHDGKCQDPKPHLKLPPGQRWACQNGRWTVVGKAEGPPPGHGGGGHGGGGQGGGHGGGQGGGHGGGGHGGHHHNPPTPVHPAGNGKPHDGQPGGGHGRRRGQH